MQQGQNQKEIPSQNPNPIMPKEPVEFPSSPDENPLPHIAKDPTLPDSAPANEKDAKISGYTDDQGRAVALAKKDVTGHPTGAFTDIGAGRSSVVKTADEGKLKKTIEDAPKMGEEQAP